ncbi:FeoA family protein, partial [Fusobacterium nucleatum]
YFEKKGVRIMDLLMAPTGKIMRIIKIKLDGEQKKQLANMGFVENANITVLTENTGNIIVNIKDSRVGIGKDIAQRIIVVPE